MFTKNRPAFSGWGRRMVAAGLASVLLVSSGCCVAFCRPNTCDSNMECKVFKPFAWLNPFNHCKKHHQKDGMECAMPCEACGPMPCGECCGAPSATMMPAQGMMVNPQMMVPQQQFVPVPQPGAMVPAQ